MEPGICTSIENTIDDLSRNQTTILNKFDVLGRNVEDLQKLMNQFSEKLIALEEMATDRRKLKTEIRILKSRIDELYAIVKEGKEDDSLPASEVADVDNVENLDVDSVNSEVSSNSKVQSNEAPIGLFNTLLNLAVKKKDDSCKKYPIKDEHVRIVLEINQCFKITLKFNTLSENW